MYLKFVFAILFTISTALPAKTTAKPAVKPKKPAAPRLKDALIPDISTTTTTTTTTTAPWIKPLSDGLDGCAGGSKHLLQVFSNNMIDTTMVDFFSFFTSFSPLNNVPNAKTCCSKCGASGTFSKCIAFDYNAQTNVCQMYAVKTEEAFYYVYGIKYSYEQAEGQSAFLIGYGYNTTYFVPQTNRYSGVYLGENSAYVIIN